MSDRVFVSKLPPWIAAGLEIQPSQPSAAAAYCRRIARGHYENFLIASLLTPRPLRPAIDAIYAYSRAADDLADEGNDASIRLEFLGWWEDLLRQMCDGVPRHAIFIALQPQLEQHALPRQPLHDLLHAFRQDQTVTRYDDRRALLDYCRGSANPVGRLMLALAKAAGDRLNRRLSDTICTALQWTNHCQDVAADYERGRIYLPRSSWRACGVEEAMFERRSVCPELRALVRLEVEYAEQLFAEGMPLVQRVPKWLSTDLQLFIGGGRAALAAIRRADFDVWTKGRPRVRRRDQLRLLCQAYVRRWLPEAPRFPVAQEGD